MTNLTRRQFIALSSLSGASLLANPVTVTARPTIPSHAKPGFEVLIFATNWGFEGTWDQFCRKIKSLGYDGAEAWYPQDPSQRKEFLTAFEKHGLRFGFLVGGSERDPGQHLGQFKTAMNGALLEHPVYINCHSGRDHFSFAENKVFIDTTTEANARTGVPIYHETHRSRILYSAPVARHFMETIPELQLTLDISHWCTVHESLLQDQAESVALALSKTGHIHARVGHAEGPQVNDPRAGEWKDALDAHLHWWDVVAARKRSEGKQLTMLTEFGPPNYLPTLPYTRQPVADQWELNIHMLNMLRRRYA